MNSNFGSLDGSIYDTLYVARMSQIPRTVESQSDLYDVGQTRGLSPRDLEGGLAAELPEGVLKPTPSNGR